MMNEDSNTNDADRAAYIDELAHAPNGRPAARYMRQATAGGGNAPTQYMTNFVAQRTVAATRLATGSIQG